RSGAGALLAQGTLHAQLLQVEWAAEKLRLRDMLLALLTGAAFLICSLLSAGALLLTLSWDTRYRTAAMVLLLLLYCLGAAVAWHRFQVLAARGSLAFADTREELAADIDLIRSRLSR